MAEVQGYLFHCKEDPYGALAGAAAWSEQKLKEGLSSAAEGSLKDQEPDREEGFRRRDLMMKVSAQQTVAGADEWSEQRTKEDSRPAADGSLKDQTSNSGSKKDVPEIESGDEGVSSTGDTTG